MVLVMMTQTETMDRIKKSVILNMVAKMKTSEITMTINTMMKPMRMRAVKTML